MDERSYEEISDPSRLRAVHASRLLDTAPEKAFDDLTRLAATLTNTPFAFATLVDEQRSFWKSCFGIPDTVPHQNTVAESFCQYVVRSGRELIVTDASVDSRTRENPSVQSMGVRAWAGFPLRAPGGEVLGSFCVVDTAAREWSDQDLEVLRTLADAATREIELRSLVFEAQAARDSAVALAQTLQQTLLPPITPEIRRLQVATRFHPAGNGAELGGDFYDVFQSGTDKWSFLIGDVCGKGIEAAKVASLARHAMGVASIRHADPVEVLSWLHETILARSPAPDRHLTAFYGDLTITDSTCEVHMSSAGHVPPILRRADGTTTRVDVKGVLVGTWVEFEAESVRLSLSPGDSLVLYTDGVSEARTTNRFFGEEAVLELVQSADSNADAEAIADRILQAALTFSGGTTVDDVAILVLRVPELTPEGER